MKSCSACKGPLDPTYSHKSLCRACNAKRANEHYHKKVRPLIPNIDEKQRINDLEKSIKEEAKSIGLKHYQSVKPCLFGHLGLRLVSIGQCIQCSRERKIKMRKSSASEMRLKKHHQLRRKIASNMGQTHFMAVLPCIKGVISNRLVSTGQCCHCLALRKKPHDPSYRSPNHDRRVMRTNAQRRSKHGKIKNKEYYREKLAENVHHKLTSFMRSCLRRAFIRKDGKRTHEIVGFSNEKLRLRLETNFSKGMSWENYGEWHIDHVKPISAFLKQGIKDPRIINALCNLQPLWGKDNLSKGQSSSVTKARARSTAL